MSIRVCRSFPVSPAVMSNVGEIDIWFGCWFKKKLESL